MENSKISQAVKYLWVTLDKEKGAEAYKLLEEAKAEGNPDAYYFLARCHAGKSYVNPKFGFEDNDAKTEKLLDLAIENGSALAMFSARRFGGYKPRCGSYIHAPYQSEREVWDAVCKQAENGDAFAKYLVANAYYYGDVIEILDIDLDAMDKKTAFETVRGFVLKAANLFEELFDENVSLGVTNYINIYESGDYGIATDKAKILRAQKVAADNGSTYYMVEVGINVRDTDPELAGEYFERAAALGDSAGCLNLGKMYSFGGSRPRDLAKARDLIEKCLQLGDCTTACNNRLGEIYFYGGDGVEQDYKKAFNHFMEAYKDGNYWASDMVGMCYLKGCGVEQNYPKALAEFERDLNTELSIIGRGEIYAYGLGVRQNISKGMECWNRLPDHPAVIEQKKNFKKTLFGWKQIL